MIHDVEHIELVEPKPMADSVFREYDIRGIVGSELSLDQMYDLGKAIATYAIQTNPRARTVAIGMDGRIHSPRIKDLLSSALADSGFDVTFIGMCPSPALYFTMFTKPFDLGLMITASHNPKEYNGIKICLGHSFVCGAEIQKIYKLFKGGKWNETPSRGSIVETLMINEYVDWLVEHFNHLKNMTLSTIIDCGNAVGGLVFPLLLEKMNWPNVRLLYEDVDGTYPHHPADPTVLSNMLDLKAQLLKTEADLGIGLDGDADRMGVMTKNGQLIPGDRLLALFAQDVLKHHPGCAIAFDVKSSAGLIDLLKKWEARPIMACTGHASIKNTMKKHNALLGGELSCHFFFHDRYFGFDDGIYAALRLFELLEVSEKSLEELLTVFPKKESSPEIRLSCPLEKMQPVIDHLKEYFSQQRGAELITIDGVRVETLSGWGIVRASNTQPVLSMRFEADSVVQLQQIKNEFITVLRDYFEEGVLQKEIIGAEKEG